MALVSYAQHGEDIILSRLFHGSPSGFYVDVGANDPVFCSVTKRLYDLGWSGINVEPVPALHRRLQDARPRDRNLQLGISNREGTLTFYESPAITGWSTFSAPMAEAYRRRGLEIVERSIPVTTLTNLFATYVDRPVDFLKIDVEGYEREVIEGIDWAQCRPRVLILEDSFSEGWGHRIPEDDYLELFRDGINRYYVRRGEPALLAAWRETEDLPGRFRRPRIHLGRRLEGMLASMSSRDELGPLESTLRVVVSRLVRVTNSMQGRRKRAG